MKSSVIDLTIVEMISGANSVEDLFKIGNNYHHPWVWKKIVQTDLFSNYLINLSDEERVEFEENEVIVQRIKELDEACGSFFERN